MVDQVNKAFLTATSQYPDIAESITKLKASKAQLKSKHSAGNHSLKSTLITFSVAVCFYIPTWYLSKNSDYLKNIVSNQITSRTKVINIISKGYTENTLIPTFLGLLLAGITGYSFWCYINKRCKDNYTYAFTLECIKFINENKERLSNKDKLCLINLFEDVDLPKEDLFVVIELMETKIVDML